MEVLRRHQVMMGAAGSGGTRLIQRALMEGLDLHLVVDRQVQAIQRLIQTANELREFAIAAPIAKTVKTRENIGKAVALVDNLDTVGKGVVAAAHKKIPAAFGTFVFPHSGDDASVGIVSITHPDRPVETPHPAVQVWEHPALRGQPAGDGEMMNALSASLLPPPRQEALDRIRDLSIRHLFLNDGNWRELVKEGGHGVVVVRKRKVLWIPVHPTPLREGPERALVFAFREGLAVVTPRGIALPDGSWLKVVEESAQDDLWRRMEDNTWEGQFRKELRELRKGVARTIRDTVDNVLSSLGAYPSCE